MDGRAKKYDPTKTAVAVHPRHSMPNWLKRPPLRLCGPASLR
jgi:hypothetical protein